MKIVKVSNLNSSYSSTDLNTIARQLKKQIEQSIEEGSNRKFIVEIFDINDDDFTPGSGLQHQQQMEQNHKAF